MSANVTVNKQKFNLEQVVANAVEKASDGYVCAPDLRAANGDTFKAYLLTVARYMQAILGVTVRYDRLDPDDLIGSLHDILKKRARTIGARTLSAKYGKAFAEELIYKHTGRHITLQA